ncbi:MAG: hypothetical protein CVV60_02520 [Tenericutes bacterium HGW-Tenericutes-5]|jgi:hypothetical protein|nr:MAG: hypothetical protein CVV60_02520 [Tenericutes bacterium HGW-Tenericutes-5]
MIQRFLFSKKGLIISSVLFVLFIAFVLPYFSVLTANKTNSYFSPDTGFFYSLDEFYNNMEIYGIEGRDFYILMRWTFDVIWPLVYFSFFISSLGNLTKKQTKKNLTMFLTLPFIGVGFDLLENILATVNVSIYPERTVFLLKLLQVSSLLKWLFIILAVVSIVYFFVLSLIKKNK